MLLMPLLVGLAMIAATTAVHLMGLSGLIAMLRWREDHGRHVTSPWRQMALVMVLMMLLFLLHAIQIWMYAVLYVVIEPFSTFEEALYFSTVTFTTVGYGDVILEGEWRMVAAIESANGFLLLGWSTAFLLQVVSRMRSVEFRWLERREEEQELFEARHPERARRDPHDPHD